MTVTMTMTVTVTVYVCMYVCCMHGCKVCDSTSQGMHMRELMLFTLLRCWDVHSLLQGPESVVAKAGATLEGRRRLLLPLIFPPGAYAAGGQEWWSALVWGCLLWGVSDPQYQCLSSWVCRGAGRKEVLWVIWGAPGLWYQCPLLGLRWDAGWKRVGMSYSFSFVICC